MPHRWSRPEDGLRTRRERGQGVGDASCLPGREVVWRAFHPHQAKGQTR
jgi:hypothetical protein